MKLKVQAVFGMLFQIIFVCLIIFFSQKFGMGYENKWYDLDEEVVFLPGYSVPKNFLIHFLFLFNFLFFVVYMPLMAVRSSGDKYA